MKKLYTLALFLTLSLAACGSDDSSSDKEETDEPVEEATAKTNTKEDQKETPATETGNKFYADGLKEDVPLATDGQAELTQESYDFIVANSGLIPAKDDASIAEVKSKAESVDIKLLNKNLSPYYGTFVTYEGYVVQIEETSYENGEVVSWLNIYDEVAATNHNVLLYKSSGDILEQDYVQFWGTPLAKYSYETLEGGYQNSIMFAGSHAEKK